jgi:hypothetical protein
MTDEERRIRSYLTAQGAKLSPAELIEKVRAAMDDLHAALSAVPGSRFAERPALDDWSANEVMAHVVNAGALFGEGINRALDGAPAGPAVADRIEAGVPTLTAVEWWERLTQDRAALFARVMRADPDAHLDRAIEHGMFGALNWRETLLFLRLHDLDHAGQLKNIAARLA